MEIKVGEYVRTKNGLIGKVNKIEIAGSGVRFGGEFLTDTIIQFNDGKVYERRVKDKNIVKHSKNIIDLIEVRRYSIYTRCAKQWFCLHLWWRNAKSSKRRYRRGLTDYKNINTSTVWRKLLQDNYKTTNLTAKTRQVC